MNLKMVGLAIVTMAASALVLGGAVHTATASSGGSPMMGANNASMMSGGPTGSMMGSGRMGFFDPQGPFDLQFIDQMTVHHEGAIVSAQNMVMDSSRPELRQLANDIIASQSKQIQEMRTWRQQWYGNTSPTFGMMDSTQMAQMMSSDQMQVMMGGSMREVMGGDATDVMFLRMMIPHHRLAITMSKEALTRAQHPELKQLAQTIIEEQSAQIRLMQQYLHQITAPSTGQSAPMMGSGMMAP